MPVQVCTNKECHYHCFDDPDGCDKPLVASIHDCKDVVLGDAIRARSQCACGREKDPKYPFCYHCFWELPEETRKGLYAEPGTDQFQQAYQEAIRKLSREKPDRKSL